LSKNCHKKLLEIGCGLESIFLFIDSYDSLTVVEPGELFYQKAVEDAGDPGNKNIKIIKSLIEDVAHEMTAEKFDFILVSSLLHEIPHPERLLETVHQISSKDTVIHINVPNARSFHRLLAVEMGLINSEFQKSEHNIQFQQQGVFSLESLIELTERSGFKVIESGSYSFKPFTHRQMQGMIDASLLTDKMLHGFYRMEKYLPQFGSEIYVNIKKA